jgi:glutaredoxin
MHAHALTSQQGGTVELDLCFDCQGIWIDPQENLRLAPAAVVELLRVLHDHRDDLRRPLATRLGCPRCERALEQGFDLVKSGRYVTFRCAQRHGRFSTFSSFMVEKGFVRHLTKPEIEDIARRVGIIHCAGCGAPVDVRKDHACPHCRAALSLLDPQAVERALAGYATAVRHPAPARAPDVADALIAIERDRLQAEREAQARRGTLLGARPQASGDLWAAGVEMVWKMLT